MFKKVINILSNDNARVKIGYCVFCIGVGLVLSGKLK